MGTKKLQEEIGKPKRIKLSCYSGYRKQGAPKGVGLLQSPENEIKKHVDGWKVKVLRYLLFGRNEPIVHYNSEKQNERLRMP